MRFAGVTGGEGPPVLLLHGFPQTHIAWRRIAPTLAKSHTVIIPDLPGYGASHPDQMEPPWTKRRAGEALVVLMDALGHDRFSVVGHDRGARVGYRLTLDHPNRVFAYASLAVVPTLDVMAGVDLGFAVKNFHWFFLAQEADLPERMLAADPDAFMDRTLEGMTGGRGVIDQAAREAYLAAFRDPAVRHAICEDYRAAVTEDLAFDRADREAGRKLPCPVMVLWPEADWVKGGPTPVEIWRRWADDVKGGATGGGHLQAEDVPDEVMAKLGPFLDRPRNGLVGNEYPRPLQADLERGS
ncbi:alpha/beta fold hydrolase [Methylorubrum thiocyanatum]|uniref:alpha/beta fold hydrolase n=1 Tax=Methylorubrum thiocyanatum TaxID=47958 RepID=UPI00383B2857